MLNFGTAAGRICVVLIPEVAFPGKMSFKIPQPQPGVWTWRWHKAPSSATLNLQLPPAHTKCVLFKSKILKKNFSNFFPWFSHSFQLSPFRLLSSSHCKSHHWGWKFLREDENPATRRGRNLLSPEGHTRENCASQVCPEVPSNCHGNRSTCGGFFRLKSNYS